MSETIRLQATLAQGIALCPEDLRRAGVAFEGAWSTVAATYGRDVSDLAAIECHQLAQIVMDLVQKGPMSPAEIAAACIERMRPPPARPDITQSRAS